MSKKWSIHETRSAFSVLAIFCFPLRVKSCRSSFEHLHHVQKRFLRHKVACCTKMVFKIWKGPVRLQQRSSHLTIFLSKSWVGQKNSAYLSILDQPSVGFPENWELGCLVRVQKQTSSNCCCGLIVCRKRRKKNWKRISLFSENCELAHEKTFIVVF